MNRHHQIKTDGFMTTRCYDRAVILVKSANIESIAHKKITDFFQVGMFGFEEDVGRADRYGLDQLVWRWRIVWGARWSLFGRSEYGIATR
jgi:hypothetical protein